jgi:hypothetical protein
MLPIIHVGITPTELQETVEGEIWQRWCTAEPDLAWVQSLAALDELRGRDATDGPMGALIRLAAQDGGNDELAGIAIVHLLEGGIGRQVRKPVVPEAGVLGGRTWDVLLFSLSRF